MSSSTTRRLRGLTVGILTATVWIGASPAQAAFDCTQINNWLTANAPTFLSPPGTVDPDDPAAVPTPIGGKLIVTHKGSLVCQKKFGQTSFAAEQPQPIFSASKSVAAVVAMMMIQDTNLGLSLNTYVGDLITEDPEFLAGQPYGTLQLKHLLSMTSGIPAIFPRDRITDIPTCLNAPTVFAYQCVDIIVDQTRFPQNGSPGLFYEYSGAGWTVLGLALSRAYNNRYGTMYNFTDLARIYLFNRCGWLGFGTTSFYKYPSPTDTGVPDANYQGPTTPYVGKRANPWVGGSFNTTATIGAALSELMRTGICNGQQALSPTSLSAMRAVRFVSPEQLYATATDPYAGTPYKQPYIVNLDANMRLRTYGFGQFRPDWPGRPNDMTGVFVGPGRSGAQIFYQATTGQWSAFLLMFDPIDGFGKGTKVVQGVVPLIKAQADANP